MKAALFISLCLTLSIIPAHALPDDLANQSCAAINLQMAQISTPADVNGLVPESPIMHIIDIALDGLDADAIARIKGSAGAQFARFCATPQRWGMPPDILAGIAFDRALTFHGLNRDLPRWGILDLPPLNAADTSCLDVRDAAEKLPKASRDLPVNDLFRVLILQRLNDYKLESLKEIKTAKLLIPLVGFECEGNTPIADLVDRVATRGGLMLRAQP